MPQILYREALNQALREEMHRDPNIFLMGEEVGFYQGAFKVSKGLLEEFGPQRVIDTPITEAGFTGIGIGAAMAGLRPIIEMMTFNFAILALDQIVNNAVKIRYMSGGQFEIPIVVRGPGGPSRQLAAQHSQTLDAWFCHVAGLIVIAPATPADAKGLLKSAVRQNNPVIFLEGQELYALRGEVPEGEFTSPIGKGEIKRSGRDITVVAWSRMLHVVLEAAGLLDREGLSVEVFDPRTLKPFDFETLLESVRKTNRLLVVEQAWPFCGVGAEVAYRVQRDAFDWLDSPVERLTGHDVPMPYSRPLELAAVPSVQQVVEAVRKIVGGH